jgi:hypothetical protein
MDEMNPYQDEVYGWNFVKSIMNFRLPQKTESLLLAEQLLRFWRRTVLHGFSSWLLLSQNYSLWAENLTDVVYGRYALRTSS